jgi:hypothetical protein
MHEFQACSYYEYLYDLTDFWGLQPTILRSNVNPASSLFSPAIITGNDHGHANVGVCIGRDPLGFLLVGDRSRHFIG